MLHDFIAGHRDEIIERCIARAPIRPVSRPTTPTVNHGVPVFLNELVDALRPGFVSSSQIAESAVRHGHNLLLQGYTVSQVVHDYGNVCQAVTQLAVELNAPISIEDFRALNRCLDDAIAGAVSQYGSERNQSTVDLESARATEQLGFLAHEMRNLVHTALLAFEVLKSGDVGVNGSTGEVLNRSLLGLRALVEKALNDVRGSRSRKHVERFRITELIEELVPSARVEAKSRGVTLRVLPVDRDTFVEGDRQVLAAVVSNLLQNAFKYTRPGTPVTLWVAARAERVLIEVEDECGGLVGGNAPPAVSTLRVAECRSDRPRPWPRVRAMGRADEQRPVVRAEPARQRLYFHPRPAAGRRAVTRCNSFQGDFMTTARGDSKPCTNAGCAGLMHFKRTTAGGLRWVCDKDVQHK